MKPYFLALLALACSSEVTEEAPAEVSWAECQRRFEIDPTDHSVCQAMLESECSTLAGADQEEACLRAVFFPDFYRCWEQDSPMACERALQVDCSFCRVARPALVAQLQEY
jgi:hypothetical protein